MTTLVVVMLAVSATTFGQGFGFGLKGGLNFGNVDFDDATLSSAASSTTGFHIGAFAKLMITDKIGVQPEIFYSVQGTDLEFNIAGVGNVKSQIDINYLQVPILLRISPAPIINFHIGPQFGILLKAESDDGTDVEDVKEDFKSGDFALAVGAGLDLPMGLSLTLRYVKGLSDSSDDTAVSSAKNNMFQVSVGFQLIGLGK